MPPKDDQLPRIRAREQAENARRRYFAAIVAASEWLRHAEQRFDESSAAIDAHIQRALAAAGRGIVPRLQLRASVTSPQQSKGSVAGRTRIPSRTRPAPSAAAAPSLAPMPSRALP